MLNKQELNLLRRVYNHPEYKALQEENKRLKDLVKKLETTNKSLKIEAKKVETKALKYKKAAELKEAHIQKLKVNISNLKKYHGSKAPKSYKGPVDMMDKTARKKFMQNTLYIPQMIRRLQEKFGAEMKPEWLSEIQEIAMSMSANDLYFLVKELGIVKMYYESDSTYTGLDTELTMSAEEVYNVFVQSRD